MSGLTSSTLVGAILGAMILLSGCAANGEVPGNETTDRPVVATKNGKVRGTRAGHILSFRGIPFAAPPTGPLRWKAAMPHGDWSVVRDAAQFGPACMQPEVPGKVLTAKTQSEDCLTLNVWTSGTKTASRPVMVWIHGGAFRIGDSSQAIYDGTAFAQSGIVLVSINYRLGYFGFMAHPALRAEGGANADLANFGLTDQIAALKWVKDNIAAFGGDPSNVTVFGQSAGAASIVQLLASPKSVGLIDKAIIESGGDGGERPNAWTTENGHPAYSETCLEWARKRGFEAGSVTASELRALPAKEVLGGEFSSGIGWGPVIDGVIVTDSASDVFSAGKQLPVPVIVGSNSYEASLMKSFRMPPKVFLKRLGSYLDAAKRVYDATNDKELAEDIFGDALFVAPSRRMARQVDASGQDAWLYYFDYQWQGPRRTSKGSKHGLEIPFVFRTLDTMFEGRPLARRLIGEEEQALSARMHARWVRFANTGSPSGIGPSGWPSYSADKDVTLVIQREGDHPETGWLSERLDLQDEIRDTAVD